VRPSARHATRDSPPDAQRQQRQRERDRPQGAAQHGAQDRIARIHLFAHVDLDVALGPVRRVHAPGDVVDRHGAKAALERGAPGARRPGRRVGRAQREPAFVEDLERDLGRIAVQDRRVGDVVAFDLRVLHDQQRRGLREVAVQELVEFVPRVQPGERGGRGPQRQHHREHQREQAALQRSRPAHVGFEIM
jgi:hypothetical protein